MLAFNGNVRKDVHLPGPVLRLNQEYQYLGDDIRETRKGY